MHVSNIPIDELKPFTRNPKKHPEKQIKFLQKSFKEFGWTNPILVAQDNMIVAGHGRWEAAKQAGFTEVPVIKLDMPYEKAVAYVIADNHLAELAETDTEQLAELLQEISQYEDFDIGSIGYDIEDLEEMMKDVGACEVADDDFDSDVEIIETGIKYGDIIKLGNHVLMCGDATKQLDVDSVVGDNSIKLVFTDPPYDLDYDLVLSAFDCTKQHTDLQFWMGSDKQQIKLAEKNFDLFTHFFVHDFKCATMISNSQPMQRHNLISKFGNCKINNLFDGFTTIIPVATERGTETHRLFRMGKRVELPAQILMHYANRGDGILDVFGGSGSTLIACEQLGMTCCILELEPERCEMIKRRYEKYVSSPN